MVISVIYVLILFFFCSSLVFRVFLCVTFYFLVFGCRYRCNKSSEMVRYVCRQVIDLTTVMHATSRTFAVLT